MKYKAYALVAILVAAVAGTVGTTYAQAGFTVETDKTDYVAGETITVSGNVGVTPSGQPGVIKVINPNGAVARFDPEIFPAADGSFVYEFPLGGPLGVDGEYTVEFTYGGVTRETTFTFTGLEGGWLIATLSIEDRTYRIQYMIEGGTLDDLNGDPDSATITADITADDDGQLTIRLPRDVADAREDVQTGDDIDYEIFLDDEEDSTTADDDFGEDFRELTIDFNAETTSIDIVGTWVVPEFGTIAAIVLAVAIVGIIVATTKYSKFRFLPKF